MARLCPFRQFVDASGLPLASGLIHTYITGTTTPKTTYTDTSGDTALPNPVVLTSAGTKEIWMDVDAAYTFVIADSNDTTLNTIDGLLPVTNLALASGSADIDLSGYSILTTTGDLTLAPVAGSHVSISGYTMPSGLPSIGQVPVATSSTTVDWGAPGAPVATAADMVAATSTTSMVTPARMKNVANTIVAWVEFLTASSGTAAAVVFGSANVISVTRVSALMYDVVLTNALSGYYAIIVGGGKADGTLVTGSMNLSGGQTSTTFRITMSHEGIGVFGMITVVGTLA